MFILNKENKIDIEPKILYIPEFKKIWDRDYSKGKSKSKKEFAYIYYIADYKSEYNAYGFEKQEKVAEDIMGDPSYHPDKEIREAIEKYERLQETYSMRYLKSVRETVNSLMRFYDDLRYKGQNKENLLQFDPKPVLNGLKDVELVLEKLQKWEKKVYSEEDDMNIRGGGHVGIFEDKENATWIKK